MATKTAESAMTPIDKVGAPGLHCTSYVARTAAYDASAAACWQLPLL